ncbi:MAG: SDR family NAD(P)-dependent oxidoreductase [Propionibacteriaceae bacterium]|nr:SDR family NAD(P)-dependent oxidoreductase [Propionibacteriaceae bacterium]
MDRREPRTALVVGAAGGTGLAIVDALASAGWQVVASDLDVGGQPSRPGVEWVPADVTDEASLEALADRAGVRLHAVIYSAGLLGVGAMAQMPIGRLEHVMQVNALGFVRLVQACLPALVEAQGRVVVLSSEVAGQKGAPFNGPYSMSKKMLDTAADSLRQELGLLGVDVVKVRPGPIRTPMVAGIADAFEKAADEAPLFAATIRQMGQVAATATRGMEPDVVAAVVLKALTVPRPRASYAVGQDRGRAVLDKLPSAWSDAIIRRVLTG